MKDVNLLSSDEEQIAWCEAQNIRKHKFVGSLDGDCEFCQLSIYMAIHDDSFPNLDSPN